MIFRKLIAVPIRKAGSLLHIISRKIYLAPAEPPVVDKQAKRVIPWRKVDGDKTLRLEYELTEKSVVMDLGGYEGQWASDIFSKYGCTIYVFEPCARFYNEIADRFVNNNKIEAFNFGLGVIKEQVQLAVQDDGSSVYRNDSNETESVQIIPFESFLDQYNIDEIDLLKINIEGAEYGLMEHLLDLNLAGIIKNVQIQFHDFVPNAESRMKNIQERLSKTHVTTYQYPFVWENWRLK